jgi:hypothetical protein
MEINPFDNTIVSEPRRIEKPVVGLNDAPLSELVRRFEILARGAYPRAVRLGSAQFVVSPAPGYGKSHLIGRLFKGLRGRATLVYLRPFANPSSCWKSILLRMTQEMEFPDSAEAEFCGDEDCTQLEALVHGVLMNLLVAGLDDGTVRTKNRPARLEYFKGVTFNELRGSPKWITWVNGKLPALASMLQNRLKGVGITLNASASSWIAVLVKYAYFRDDFEIRQTCLDWLRGGSADDKEAERIPIRVVDRASAESSLSEANWLCRERITDLCSLAGFYRPFVFCFDQTENYAVEPGSARSLGLVIQRLVDEDCNHMTVVTANQEPWEQTIKPHWEHAHVDRLRRPHIELQGLNQQQARELIIQRLEGWDLSRKDVVGFTDRKWLTELFRDMREWGVRHFLTRCAERWARMKESPREPKGIEELFQSYVQRIRTQPKRMVFDPDVLYWLMHEVARGLPGIAVEEFKSQKGYLVLLWRLKSAQIYFGFEAGSNWSRWNAINREARKLVDANRARRMVFFRTPELGVIPPKTWRIAPELKQAMGTYLHIVALDKSEMAELYAAYDLYTDAVEGNIPFETEHVLAFIRGKLKDFWTRISEPNPSKWRKESEAVPEPVQAEPQKSLVDKIREILQREKFLSVQDLMARISPPVTEEDLHTARSCVPEIKVHVSPTLTVLQWRPDA